MAWFKSRQEKTEESLLAESKKQSSYLRDFSENSAAAGGSVAGGVRRAASKSVFALKSHNTFLFLILVFALNFYHVWRNSFGFPGDVVVMMLYVFVAFLGAFVFYNDAGDPMPWERFGKFLLISAAAYFVPFLIKYLKDLGFIHVPLATFLMILAPVWVIYIFLNPGDSEFTRKLAVLFFFGWIMYIAANGLLQLGSGTEQQIILLSPGEAREAFAIVISKIRGTATGVGNTVTSPQRLYNSTKEFFAGQVSSATQEYYTGTVDQSQGIPIGVFITDTQPIYTRFHADSDDVIVTGTLTARTFSEHLTVENKCFIEIFDTTDVTKAGNVVKPGEVQPDKVEIYYTGEFQDKYALDCTVKNEEYKSSIATARTTSGTVFFNSTFGFETWGYAEYGFMDRNLMLAFRNENQDPAAVLGLSHVLRPKYTPGPLMVGMPSDTQPIAYDSANPRAPAFGVTFSNAWVGKGAVGEFRTVELIIPKPFRLTTADCVPEQGSAIISGKPLEYAGPEVWDENSAYSKYTVTNVGIRPGESYITLRCPMTVDPTEARTNPVIGSAGAGKFTFFVHANYTYSTWTRTPVTIQGAAQ